MKNGLGDERMERGTVVRLKSGSPLMTVGDHQWGKSRCHWYNEGLDQFVETDFFPQMLRPVCAAEQAIIDQIVGMAVSDDSDADAGAA